MNCPFSEFSDPSRTIASGWEALLSRTFRSHPDRADNAAYCASMTPGPETPARRDRQNKDLHWCPVSRTLRRGDWSRPVASLVLRARNYCTVWNGLQRSQHILRCGRVTILPGADCDRLTVHVSFSPKQSGLVLNTYAHSVLTWSKSRVIRCMDLISEFRRLFSI